MNVHSGYFFKQTGKVFCVVDADLFADVKNSQAAVCFKKRLGMMNSALRDIVAQGNLHSVFKFITHIAWGYAGILGDIVDRDVGCKMAVNIMQRSENCPAVCALRVCGGAQRIE